MTSRGVGRVKGLFVGESGMTATVGSSSSSEDLDVV